MNSEQLKKANEKMEAALKVITLDRSIRAFLEQNDPMALKQCLDAINGWEEYFLNMADEVIRLEQNSLT